MTHACSCGREMATIDARQLPPRVRHPRIFATFDALPEIWRVEICKRHVLERAMVGSPS